MGEESTIKIICSFGGEIARKCGSCIYEGGTTWVMKVHRTINFHDLLCKVNESYNYMPTAISTIKYRYPGVELDCPLVSITKDKDVSDMMQEYSSPTATPIQLFGFAPQSSFHEPRVNLDSVTIQSTPSILRNSEITSSSHMVYPSSQDGDQSILSHLHELPEAWPIVIGSIQDHDNATLDATPRILPENNETNTSSQRMIDGNFHAENTIRGIVTGAEPQPKVVDNSGYNNTGKMSSKLFEGQEFRNSDAFDMALREHAICSNFEYKLIRTSHDRIVRKCNKDGCPWHVRASKVPGGSSFRINTLESNHTHELTKLPRNHQASDKWTANFIKGQVRKRLRSKPNDIVVDIGREYGIKVSCHIARRGKDLVLEEVHIGCSIHDLAAYCDEIERTNPGSFVTLGFPSHGLLGIFIAYHATIFGFQHACRPIITLHSRNIEGDYPHIWLYATGLDAGYNSFLVAYALVESSNEETWTWFCDQLAHILVDRPKITIITVKQENSSKAVYRSFPDACHRYCRQCLYEDFGRKFRENELHRLFRGAIDAESEATFRSHMDAISKISPEAQTWINEISPRPRYWTVYCFDGQQDCEHDHPIVEEFDIWSDDRNAMTSSVISILRHFHAKMREIFLRNRVEESSDQALGQLTPYALTRLHREKNRDKLCFVSAEHNHLQTQFHVRSFVDSGHTVDLSDVDLMFPLTVNTTQFPN